MFETFTGKAGDTDGIDDDLQNVRDRGKDLRLDPAPRE